MLNKIKYITLSLLFFFPDVYAQNIYYVTGGGSHGDNNCLSRTAACSFAKINTLANAGDTVIVIDSGDYLDWNSHLRLVNGGTADNHITIKAEGSIAFINRKNGWAYINTPYVDIINIGCNGGGHACVAIRDTNNVTVTGLVAINGWRGVDIQNSSHNLVQFSTMIGNSEGVYIWDNSNNNTLKGNLVRNNGNKPPVVGKIADRCGLCVGGANAGSDNTITRNILYKNSGFESDSAIATFEAPKTTITHNYIEGNNRGAIFVAQYSTDSFIAWNTAIGNGLGCESETNISTISVRNKSDRTVVLENVLKDNCVAHGNQWGDTSPRCDIDVVGWLDKSTDDISFISNIVDGTINGESFCINEQTTTNNIKMY